MSRRLKNWITAYLEYVKHSEAPDDFHKWSAIATIAGALRRRVWFDMGYFTWYPNFFMFFVAPAGIVSKSTTMSLGIDLLREVEGIKFGPPVITWQAMVEALEAAQEDVFFKGEFYPMAALTIPVSELGTFLDPKNRQLVDVLVDLWDGKQGAWEKVTKTGTSERIVNPWIQIIGCTTPSWIAENFSDYFFGGGLASRSILVYGEQKRKLVAYPKRHFHEDIWKLKQALIFDLGEIAKIFGEYQLTEDAYDWGEEWYERHWTQDLHEHIEGEKFSAYLARKQTHMHKVAMVMAASESDELLVHRRHLEEAEKEITALEYNMPRVYGKMNVEAEARLASDVYSHIKKVGKITKTQLYQEFWKTMSYQTFSKVLESLMNTNLIKLQTTPQGVFIGTTESQPKQAG